MRYDGNVLGFRRITMNPEVMGGKPCIRGMRVTVGMIVEALAAGRTVAELLADFPYLEEEDIREALAFAARFSQGHEIRKISAPIRLDFDRTPGLSSGFPSNRIFT